MANRTTMVKILTPQADSPLKNINLKDGRMAHMQICLEKSRRSIGDPTNA